MELDDFRLKIVKYTNIKYIENMYDDEVFSEKNLEVSIGPYFFSIDDDTNITSCHKNQNDIHREYVKYFKILTEQKMLISKSSNIDVELDYAINLDNFHNSTDIDKIDVATYRDKLDVIYKNFHKAKEIIGNQIETPFSEIFNDLKNEYRQKIIDNACNFFTENKNNFIKCDNTSGEYLKYILYINVLSECLK